MDEVAFSAKGFVEATFEAERDLFCFTVARRAHFRNQRGKLVASQPGKRVARP